MNEKNKQFIAEAEELIAEAQTKLLDLSERQDPDTLNALFRAIHTLKGNAGIYGLSDIEEIAHRLEELLDALRLGKIVFHKSHLEAVQRGLDLLKKSLTEEIPLKDKEEFFTYLQKATKEEKALEEESLSSRVPRQILDVLSEYEEHRLKENIKKGAWIYLKKVSYGFDEFEQRLKETLEELKKDSEVISTLPEPETMKEGKLSFKILLASDKELKDEESCEVVCKPASPKVSMPKTIKSQSDTIRINFSKIDELIEQTESIRLISEQLERIWSRFREKYGYKEEVFGLYKLMQELKRRASVLQESTLSLRMVPVVELFERLAQVTRRYARQMDKKVEIIVEGSDTEIDKRIMEEIADPLMHIVRNSIDHGIEKPSERKASGKPEIAQIFFRAKRKGSFVIIEIEDRGRGIDRDAIRAKAIQKGVIRQDDKLSEKEILELVFTPGLSTKEEATELSGRGVGMDVVKASVESLGGYVEIDSSKGEFTRVSIMVPVTMTLAKVVLVRVGEHFYGVPLESVSFTKHVHNSLQWVEGNPVLVTEKKVIPVLSLSQRFFSIKEMPSEADVVVIKTRNGDKALMIDEIISTERVLIRPLTGYLREIKAFSGVFESKGRLCLLIEPEVILS